MMKFIICIAIALFLFVYMRYYRKRKIMLLTLARCNGTIILRFFGQMPNTQIVNERLTRMFDENKTAVHHDDNIWTRLHKINQLNNEANKCTGTFITHEMADDINQQELDLLLTSGWKIVVIIRDPKKQLTSLKNLEKHGATFDTISGILNYGWSNLLHYVETKTIGPIIDSQCFLKSRRYRIQCFSSLGLKYDKKYENLNKYKGHKFHNVSLAKLIYGKQEYLNNPWNGHAANSCKLKNDTREGLNINDVDDNIKKDFAQAITMYERILKYYV